MVLKPIVEPATESADAAPIGADAVPHLVAEPEPNWEPDPGPFYEVWVIRHNAVGSTGRLSNGAYVFIHNRVASNKEYWAGDKLALRIMPGGSESITDFVALELWREEPDPESSTATLGNVFQNIPAPLAAVEVVNSARVGRWA